MADVSAIAFIPGFFALLGAAVLVRCRLGAACVCCSPGMTIDRPNHV